jgi:hypothetical protein
VSPIKSSMPDLASGCRRRDFEKKMMSCTSALKLEIEKDVQVFGIHASSVVEGRGSSWQGCYKSASRHDSRRDLRGVDDLHVAVLMLTVELLGRWVDSGLIITQLQESFYSTRRVFGSLTIVSVR